MFSKTDTTILKGVAILFMLFLHLFNGDNVDSLCRVLFHVNGIPVVHILTRCTYPVPFYLFLSGYGLYASKSNSYRKNAKRIFKLYIHYWITLAIFVSLGAGIVGTTKYPGSWMNLFNNITGLVTTYNYQVWFLLPYSILAFFSPLIIKSINKLSPFLIFLTTGIFYVIAYSLIHFYGKTFFADKIFLNLVILCFELLFPLVLGCLSAKYINLSYMKKCLDNCEVKNVCFVILLLALVLLRSLYRSNIFDGIYACLFIMLFVLIERPKWLNNFLLEIGKRSTSMWFIHSYFCYYLFHDFIYSFKYPIVIYIILIVCSYICSVIIDYLNKSAQKVLKIM
jgi:hypothetical protein